MRITLIVLAAVMAATSCLTEQTANDFQHDFDAAIREIAESYAYFEGKATRWNDVPALYATDLRELKSRDEFIVLLERVLDELYDPHVQLTVNLERSPRLVPSGADLWAEWREVGATITQVRDNSDAARAGLRPGAVVIAMDGVSIGNAVEARMGRSYAHSVAAARDWALRAVLAGRHGTRRLLEVREGGATRKVELPAGDQFTSRGAPLEASEIRPGVGYVRFNDSLGDGAVVAAFDRALEGFRRTRGLIIDLRNTPGGGNTGVAQGILGRFVKRELAYQKHALPSEKRKSGVHRSWFAYVSPRGDFVYSRPVVVLVSRWTGSMGEGLAIGFDATGTGAVVGTAMAGLVGATTQVTLPRTGIGVNVPIERLYHVNGTPREEFQPAVLVDVAHGNPGRDPFVEAALEALARSAVSR
jgi:C-terminal processing protease CtpA/Prc